MNWSPLERGILEFNVNGTAKGKRGKSSRNSFGEVVAMVSKHAGVMEHNEDTLAILKVLLRTSV